MTLELFGRDLEVPLVTGERRRYVDLDVAASAPPLTKVVAAVNEALPWYSSVHRGTGFKSMVSSELFDRARASVGRFFGARADDAIVFTRNTTDAMNILASSLSPGCEVIVFETEHHANFLPWRLRDVRFLSAPHSPEHALQMLRVALDQRRSADEDCLVAVTGASNVTGEVWPLKEIVELCHRHGARVVVDAAQLAPHRAIDIADLNADYLAMSGHKLYAPFGAGVLIGRGDWLESRDPFLAGGGAVRFVTPDEVLWADLPDRQEAGTPNVLGAIALAAACGELAGRMDELARHEQDLLRLAEDGLASIPGVRQYRLWDGPHDRIGVVTFNVGDYPHDLVAAVLSAEYGIGVRSGCFCAHPMMLHLLDVNRDEAGRIRRQLRDGARVRIPGAVRASFGLGTTRDDIDRLVAAVESLASNGPAWTYTPVGDSDHGYVAVPDPRPMPFELQATTKLQAASLE